MQAIAPLPKPLDLSDSEGVTVTYRQQTTLEIPVQRLGESTMIEKRCYVKPDLISYGLVRHLTQSSSKSMNNMKSSKKTMM